MKHRTFSLVVPATVGPITTGLNVVKGVDRSALPIDSAVWVPAFAGTTVERIALRLVAGTTG